MEPNKPTDIFLPSPLDKAETVLLVHGLTGEPIEMKSVGKRLRQNGFNAYIPTLAGHGCSVATLAKTTWPEWYDSLKADFLKLCERYGKVHIVSLCAGGTLALKLAHEFPVKIKSMVIYSPIFDYDGWNMKWYYRLAKPLLGPTSKILTFLDKILVQEAFPFGIKNDRLRHMLFGNTCHSDLSKENNPMVSSTEGIIVPYPLVTLKNYLSLVKHVEKLVPQIKTPLLMIQSIQDDVSSYKGSLKVQKRYGGVADVLLINNSYHLINLDQQKDKVVRNTIGFLKARN